MPYTFTDPTNLEFFANHSRQAIFIYEVEPNHFTFLNPGFEQAFRLPAESAIDAGSLLRMVHPDDRQYVQETYQRILKDKETEEIEFRITLPEQDERWVCLTPFLISNAAGRRRVMGYAEDVTAA